MRFLDKKGREHNRMIGAIVADVVGAVTSFIHIPSNNGGYSYDYNDDWEDEWEDEFEEDFGDDVVGDCSARELPDTSDPEPDPAEPVITDETSEASAEPVDEPVESDPIVDDADTHHNPNPVDHENQFISEVVDTIRVDEEAKQPETPEPSPNAEEGSSDVAKDITHAVEEAVQNMGGIEEAAKDLIQ